ncbi:MAG: (E)-4-hydroxy-3-methylbut-2-enyl-diphosphate synthase [Candidatus Latescibacterota bacterium]|jgi:(E)-4-hydroxy-3-methylbut-2-enyl-diphosphate synthase
MPLLTSDLLVEPDKYCNSLTEYSRLKTRVVNIGGVPLGGDNPIRVQSMTTTDTMDTQGTVAQSIRMIEAGCEYVRITAPSQNEARNLENIKKELRTRGYDAPLVADIHFTPNAAEIAARIVEKVRVNPGNYADRKKFQIIEYTDVQYAEELDRIREKFTPLVNICKEYGTAMRIGTNHGSLSDRIMSRFGDTPLGMVESALEFARICESLNYHNIVFSMKSSNTQVMVQAYRLLVHKMLAENMAYPLHLGVTEAGDGEDGRIKSAVGIGTLLEDGLGDTIRVSLTEDPEAEIPVAQDLVARYRNRHDHAPIPNVKTSPIDPFSYTRRQTSRAGKIGSTQVPIVIAAPPAPITPESLKPFGYTYDPALDKWHIGDMAVDYIYIADQSLDFKLPGTLQVIQKASAWSANPAGHPLFSASEYRSDTKKSDQINFVQVQLAEMDTSLTQTITEDSTAVLILSTTNTHAMPELRRAFFTLAENNCPAPVVIHGVYTQTGDAFMLGSATDVGALFTDGFGDGIWLESENTDNNTINRTAFGILQATRTRISKTEYISCPSCGRTLFDLQETTALIRNQTTHLKGVKIGIMGCIVNGPGEMADADYGYVGSGPGKITLYKGKEVVKRNIPTEGAVDELIGLIREGGDWVEP